MTAFVFLGPTLAADEAAEMADVEVLPPVRRGDVLRLLPRRPDVIGIVDGYFESVPSVWHKEILAAMAAGVHVLGAASMGALRAAELEPFGMVGIGRVFEWYRTGVIDADDEVAVAHGPAENGYIRLSDALVDIRDACGSAAAAGVIPPDLADRLVAAAKGHYYADRTFRRTLARAGQEGEDPDALARFAGFVEAYGPGVKARDARALLARMAAVQEDGIRPLQVPYQLERTVFLERLEHEVDQQAAMGMDGDEVPSDHDVQRRTGESLDVLRKKVLLRLLARREANRIGLDVDEPELRQAVDAFRRQFGLLTQAETEQWAATEGVTSDLLVDVLGDGVLVDKLARHYGHRVAAALAGQVRVATAQRWPERDG